MLSRVFLGLEAEVQVAFLARSAPSPVPSVQCSEAAPGVPCLLPPSTSLWVVSVLNAAFPRLLACSVGPPAAERTFAAGSALASAAPRGLGKPGALPLPAPRLAPFWKQRALRPLPGFSPAASAHASGPVVTSPPPLVFGHRCKYCVTTLCEWLYFYVTIWDGPANSIATSFQESLCRIFRFIAAGLLEAAFPQ